MNEISFLKMVRDVLSLAMTQCTVQEYTPEYILKNCNKKLMNIKVMIEAADTNRAQKTKYIKVLNNCKLPYLNAKHYDIMHKDFRTKINELPSVLDLIKK